MQYTSGPTKASYHRVRGTQAAPVEHGLCIGQRHPMEKVRDTAGIPWRRYAMVELNVYLPSRGQAVRGEGMPSRDSGR